MASARRVLQKPPPRASTSRPPDVVLAVPGPLPTTRWDDSPSSSAPLLYPLPEPVGLLSRTDSNHSGGDNWDARAPPFPLPDTSPSPRPISRNRRSGGRTTVYSNVPSFPQPDVPTRTPVDVEDSVQLQVPQQPLFIFQEKVEQRVSGSLDDPPSLVNEGSKEEISAAWKDVAHAMESYDERMVKSWTDEIDTLLVFAGLFSAVLTAFLIDSYKNLQEDPAQSSSQILLQISSQLNSFVISTSPGGINFANASHQAQTAPIPFAVTHSAVTLNVLWFSSLVLSLATALFGILVKQWLREYSKTSILSLRESVRLRQHRYNSLFKWGVPYIMQALPLLLQIALILFFVGLLVLLWTLNVMVASVATGLVAAPILLVLVSTLLPAISHTCPYKSPLAWLFLHFVMSVLSSNDTSTQDRAQRPLHRAFYTQLQRVTSLPSRILGSVKELFQYRLVPTYQSAKRDVYEFITFLSSRRQYHSWTDRDVDLVQLFGLYAPGILDRDAVLWMHKQSADKDLLKSLSPCLDSLSERQKPGAAFWIMAHRLHRGPHELLDDLQRDSGYGEGGLDEQGRPSTSEALDMWLENAVVEGRMEVHELEDDLRRWLDVLNAERQSGRVSLTPFLEKKDGAGGGDLVLRRADILCLIRHLMLAFMLVKPEETVSRLYGKTLMKLLTDVRVGRYFADETPADVEALQMQLALSLFDLCRDCKPRLVEEEILQLLSWTRTCSNMISDLQESGQTLRIVQIYYYFTWAAICAIVSRFTTHHLPPDLGLPGCTSIMDSLDYFVYRFGTHWPMSELVGPYGELFKPLYLMALKSPRAVPVGLVARLVREGHPIRERERHYRGLLMAQFYIAEERRGGGIETIGPLRSRPPRPFYEFEVSTPTRAL